MAGSIIRAGDGIEISTHNQYHNDDQYEIVTISKSFSSKTQPHEIDTMYGKPGDVLMIDEHYGVAWGNPFKKDEDLRNSNPSLQAAYENLLAALYEYEAVKKMVKDYE